MTLGMLASGYLTGRLGHNQQAYLIAPSWAMICGLPFYVVGMLATSWQVALACLAVPMTTNMMYLAPATAIVQNSVPASQRSTAAAILLFILNIFGTGLGPLYVGVLSDWLEPSLGAQALRMAMIGLVPFFPIAAFSLFLVARSIPARGPEI